MQSNKLCYCGNGKQYEKCCMFLDEIRKEYSDIKPNDEDGVELFNKGMNYLNCGELTKAEKLFKILTQSQPQHHDGFLGLAQIYLKKGERDKMIYFYEQAIKRAKEFLKDDSIDLEAIEYMENEMKEAIKS
ncbi:MAG: hypothetical protein BWK75_04860 [Candidatus Altiarchaeales archaeon A3]|nr:MAG: hypothetical protein BWK75_04860 [Candidatus Altiarchaeales archaeon A3]